MKSYDVSAKRWFENIAFLKFIFSAKELMLYWSLPIPPEKIGKLLAF